MVNKHALRVLSGDLPGGGLWAPLREGAPRHGSSCGATLPTPAHHKLDVHCTPRGAADILFIVVLYALIPGYCSLTTCGLV